jgi:hypothetical protein
MSRNICDGTSLMQIPTPLPFCACRPTVKAAILGGPPVASGLDLGAALDLDPAAVRFNN